MAANFNPSFTPKQKVVSTKEIINGILSGNRQMLSKGITILESTLAQHVSEAEQILTACLPKSGNSIRIGITGIPGVGKSTFIESFGKNIISKGHKVAVLAIDPSSQKSKGSILGDKTRMEKLSSDSNAFIRPSPNAGAMGGINQATRESIILCEAAGFDVILVETVGVGQSEIAVHSMVDLFMLLTIPGTGDELQGIKRGIMEMADLVVINKVEKHNQKEAKLHKRQLFNAMHLFPSDSEKAPFNILLCSALQETGLEEIWNGIIKSINKNKNSGFFKSNRANQNNYWFEESIRTQLITQFQSDKNVFTSYNHLKKEVQSGMVSPFQAANELIKKFRE